jgi:hypothetical protein
LRSWSANLCGRKLWIFFPPEYSHCLFDKNFNHSSAENKSGDDTPTSHLVYNVVLPVDSEQFPYFDIAMKHAICLIQYAGKFYHHLHHIFFVILVKLINTVIEHIL